MMKYLFSLLFLISMLSCTKQSADLIVTNAIVYTVNDEFATAEAFVVKDGKFIAVGTTNEITSTYTSENVIDAAGKAIFPGLYDPHSHFMGLGQMLSQADLVGTTSYGEIIERLKSFEKENPNNQWLVGRGWDQNDWEVKEFPTKELLDEAFPDKPVALTRIDGHALIANSKALQLAKITSGSKVDGGDVILMNGEPTGVLIDNAQGFIRRVIPRAEEAEKRAMIQAAEAECFKYGLTTVSDAGLNRDDIELIEKMHEEGSLKIRDYVMVSLGIANLEYYLKKGIIKTDRLNVRSIKLYADGALGSRGACLLEPYADAPDQTGFLLLSAKELERSLTEIYNSDYQANTHCIGDSANRLILDIYGKLLKDKNERRWRIEHAQIVSKTDVLKFGKYSIIPSIQATHGTSDMYWADERLGDERVKTAYAFQDLLKQNGMVANGSDFPVEFVNPIFGFHSAVARQDDNNFPAGGYQMENALTREQAMRAMTIWAAYANFEEKERGSIEVGKMADFILTDKDLMQIKNEEMRGVKVLKTVIGGEVVYSLIK
jgi:predicted amidohydrolase YtcJ